MANFDSATPISSSISTIFSSEERRANTNINGNVFASFQETIVEIEKTFIPIYRGLVGSNYVVSVGSPPVGATFVTIIGFQ